MQSSIKCTYHHGTSSVVVKPVAAQESEWEVHAAHGSTTTTIVTCECAVRRQTICTSEVRTYASIPFRRASCAGFEHSGVRHAEGISIEL